MPARKPIPAGTRFARLVVIKSKKRFNLSEPRYYVRCICDCGSVKWIAEKVLRAGSVVSCGCNKVEKLIARSTIHGHSKRSGHSQVYASWADMIQRCNNPNNIGYHNYGGRGITVDPKWHDFSAFLSDMGVPVGRKMTLERKNVNGNYTKDNCCWIPKAEQALNRRDSIFVCINGETANLAKACKQYGVPYMKAYQRLKRGLSAEQALFT